MLYACIFKFSFTIFYVLQHKCQQLRCPLNQQLQDGKCVPKYFISRGHSVSLWVKLEPMNFNLSSLSLFNSFQSDSRIKFVRNVAQQLSSSVYKSTNRYPRCGRCATNLYANTPYESFTISSFIGQLSLYTNNHCTLENIYSTWNTFATNNVTFRVDHEGVHVAEFGLYVCTHEPKDVHIIDILDNEPVCPETEFYTSQLTCPFITLSMSEYEIVARDSRFQGYKNVQKRYQDDTNYMYEVCAEKHMTMFAHASSVRTNGYVLFVNSLIVIVFEWKFKDLLL